MKIIDYYLVKKILSTFFFVSVLLTSIIVIIDITEKMDDITKHHLSFDIVFSYYLAFIPWIIGPLIPITSFIAVVYVTSRLASHSEIIAMLSGGMSFMRFLFPYFIGTSLIALLSFVLNGWVIPRSNRTKNDFDMRYFVNRPMYNHQNIHMQESPNVYMYLQNYNNQTHTGYQFTLEKLEKNQLKEKITAQYIVWDSIKNCWNIREWVYRKTDTLFHLFDDTDRGQDSTLYRRGASMDTVLSIKPEDFVLENRLFDRMTIHELGDYIDKLKFRGSGDVPSYEVQLYIRYASPFTVYILVFIGAIVSSRKSRGGTGAQIALGFFLSFIFILFFMVSSTMAANGAVEPIYAAWIPNVTFFIISIFLYKIMIR